MLELNSDFKEFIQLLNYHEVEFLIVGGYALAFHGRPRFTGDIDFWIGVSADNAERLMRVLRDFGFGSLTLTAQDFMNEDIVVQFGYEPNRIDIITSVTGLDFETSFEHSVKVNLDGLMVNFLHLEDLKKNKASTGRKKDMDDLENLP